MDDLPIEMNSLWDVAAPAWDDQRLDGPVEADLAVIGAGITGLAAALRAAELGKSVVVVDAARPGWGASGRNGGQVIPGLKLDPDEIVARFGAETGERLTQFAGGAADRVFELVEKYQIECDAHRGGWIRPAHNDTGLRALDDHCAQWRTRGAAVEMLDRAALGEALGTSWYLGGSLDRRAGALHPLKYTLGLARAARGLGARIYSATRVTAFERRGDRFVLATNTGSVTADRVVMGTNGYADPAHGAVARSVVPVASFQIATEPLPADLRATIMPGHVCASDTKRLLIYFRLDAEGRFMVGGRGTMLEVGIERRFALLRARAVRLFPALEPLAWPYRWGGLVAITTDHLPHVHEPTPGLMMALGYNGRGVAMASQMGGAVAEYAMNGDARALPLPRTPIKPIPFQRLHRVGSELMFAWYGLLDRLGI